MTTDTAARVPTPDHVDGWLTSAKPLLSEKELGDMTADNFDIERFIASLSYAPDTPEIAKTLVGANLRNLNFVLSHKYNHDARSLEAQLEAARACIRDAAVLLDGPDFAEPWKQKHAAAIQSAAGER